jgi:hypothetical protein
MKYLILAMVCMGCSPVINTPVSAPIAVVTIRQLSGVLIVGESIPMDEPEVIKTWYTISDADKLKAAIEAAHEADQCECVQGDPMCDCLPSELD